MASEAVPRDRLERAIRDRDAKRVVDCVAAGDALTRLDLVDELGYGDHFPPAVVLLVLEHALTPEQRKTIHSYWWHFRFGSGVFHKELEVRSSGGRPQR